MKYSPYIYLLALLLLSGGVSATAQSSGIETKTVWMAGGLLSGGPDRHDLQFSSLPGVPSCCPGYDGGTGTSFGGGLMFGSTLGGYSAWEARLLYTGQSGRLAVEEEAFVTAERDTVIATFLHEIEESRSAVGVEGLFLYEPTTRLWLLTGARVDYVVAGTFRQSEKILEPSNIRFGNDLRTRMTFEGDLPGLTRISLTLLAGLRYDLPLDREESRILSPELVYWRGLSNVVAGRDWTMHGFRLGLGLRFGKQVDLSPSPLEPGGE